MKLNRNLAMKDGTFPKTSQHMPKDYNKEATRTEKQVVKTRMKQWKDNKANKSNKKK
jgi:hypothetical protein